MTSNTAHDRADALAVALAALLQAEGQGNALAIARCRRAVERLHCAYERHDNAGDAA